MAQTEGPATPPGATPSASEDERQLAELGYRQELTRAWSGFSNFAISFTIISILAGCFTTYGQAWNNGGPIAISIGWPLISCMILLVAFCMSELVSAYPTAGGIYWWASELGGAAWGWFAGWFNLVGLVAVVASVDYGCATFISALMNLWSVDLGVVNFADGASLGDILGAAFLFAARHRAAEHHHTFADLHRDFRCVEHRVVRHAVANFFTHAIV